MKKYIVFTFVLFLSVFSFGCTKKEKHLSDLEIIKDRGYVIVGVKEDAPPFGYYDKDGALRGIDIDLAKSISQEIFQTDSEDRIEFVLVNSRNRISKLNSKEVDMLVATMSVNDKRRLVIDFSTPYFVANQKLMVKSDSKITNINYFNK
ncbi:transporter substrate-binding domain-containing protein, partial [bacterium]|nr:transporter substrate-binding domain-containing protein [bacterium]